MTNTTSSYNAMEAAIFTYIELMSDNLLRVRTIQDQQLFFERASDQVHMAFMMAMGKVARGLDKDQ